MTRKKAIEIVRNSDCKVLSAQEDELGILILAYNNFFNVAIEYYFSKRTDYIEQQILSPVTVHKPSKMRIVENRLKYDI